MGCVSTKSDQPTEGTGVVQSSTGRARGLDELSVNIIPGVPSITPSEILPLLVVVNTPDGHSRTPSDVCIVLDISASMGVEARVKSAEGDAVSGLSLLDFAKHAVRTTIQMLTERDGLSIVIFNQDASMLLELTTMDEAGKGLAEEKLKDVVHEGSTCIWKGLHMGMEELRKNQEVGKLGHVILLTDGTCWYGDDNLDFLAAYKEQHGQLPGTINTFGFGYDIDSRLLVNLASEGDGAYTFIPDAGFLGTAFSNTLCNLLVTFAREVHLVLEPQNGAEIKEILGNFPVEKNTWGWRVRVGTLQYGQERNVVIVVATKSDRSFLKASMEYQLPDLAESVRIDAAAVGQEAEHNQIEVDVHKCRFNFIDLMVSCVDTVDKTAHSRQPIKSKIDNRMPMTPGLPLTPARLVTPAGTRSMTPIANIARAMTVGSTSPTSKQIMSVSGVGRLPVPKPKSTRSINSTGSMPTVPITRISRNLFGSLAKLTKMPSIPDDLASAEDAALETAKEAVENLKQVIRESVVGEEARVAALLMDINGEATLALSNSVEFWRWGRHYLPSVISAHQLQQCSNFKDPGLQLYGGTLFQKSREQAEQIFNKLPPPTPSGVLRPISMATYNDRYAGCIDGASLVCLASGKRISVNELSKGHMVRGPGGEVGEVLCAVKMKCSNNRIRLVDLGCGTRLTPHHPVFLSEHWVFPCDVSAPQEVCCEAVYNFVLAGAHALVVGNVPCITLGHGIEEGAACHPYYGSARAVQDILRRPGAHTGVVELSAGCVLRDPLTGIVCGLT